MYMYIYIYICKYIYFYIYIYIYRVNPQRTLNFVGVCPVVGCPSADGPPRSSYDYLYVFII